MIVVGHVIAILVGVGVFAALSASNFLSELQPGVRKSLLTVVALSSFVTLVFADQAVDSIESGSAYMSASIAVEGLSAGDLLMPTKDLKYLGHVNGGEFFRKDKITYVIESHRLLHMELVKHTM